MSADQLLPALTNLDMETLALYFASQARPRNAPPRLSETPRPENR